MHDVVVIGGGQAALAAGFYLRRAGLDFVILDAEDGPGGAWRHTWDSLRLFSPAEHSFLPGWPMPRSPDDGFPSRDHVIDYLEQYERRYTLPVERPVFVSHVTHDGSALRIEADRGSWRGRSVISATGTWRAPYMPECPGRHEFRGLQIHSAHYRSAESLAGQTVMVVGGGNSGAQILADVSRVAHTVWVTLDPPRFLPDDVDGRVLFARANAKYREGSVQRDSISLANIVMVPSVREARARGVLTSVRPFDHFTETGVVWPDGTSTDVDTVIWCTGFGSALDHLKSLNVIEADGRVRVQGTRAVVEPRLWLLGYGNWTGFASATLVGAGRTARDAVKDIRNALEAEPADVAGDSLKSTP